MTLASERVFKFTLAQLWAMLCALVVAISVSAWVVSNYLSKVETRLAAIEQKTGSAVTHAQAELWAANMRVANIKNNVAILDFKPYVRENEHP